ncbi:dihydropteroate synthase [Thalassotalea sp. M1531]|uniref:Dihydropteroate synthase n=1 Tax=Thalassotalea algicola TaxID=2716224 RepID=A0A7Y0LF49_9GAMM|nr:dihydropteroate synthase [Thalassotalea algicola]NMP33388.1 dihydropteroate synthase [Thalassotalea algicola]
MTNDILQCGDKALTLTSPQVMGILNVTPDSFSDGGKFVSFDSALSQVEQMINDGATIIDIGGESTRPGAKAVTLEDELERVIPILSAIKQRFDIVVSVDTSKAGVMNEAIKAGAGIINDVRALQNDGCLEVVAAADIPICLMHMQGMPRTMQKNPQYEDVTQDIISFIGQRLNVCQQHGIDKSRLIVDPGFGFGKTLEQNYQLLNQLSDFEELDLPLLVGISRKSMIGNLLNADVDERLAGSLSAAIISAQQGAKIIRVHDVKETVDALTVLQVTQRPELARG